MGRTSTAAGARRARPAERAARNGLATFPWYDALFEQTTLGVVVADGVGRVVDCNDCFAEMLGCARDALVGGVLSDWCADAPDARIGTAAENLPAGGSKADWHAPFRRGDGAVRWFHVTALPLGRDGALYASIVEDVTESREALAALHEKTVFLERAQEVARIGTYVADLRTRTLSLSPELARMFGAGDEALTLPIDDYRARFVHPDDMEATAPLAETRYRRGGPASWERRIVRPDGEVIWVATNSRVELDRQGRPMRTIGVVQDVTERERLVRQLRASRTRIAEASERERRRLERDLHDGAQQRLMAIQLKLGLLRDAVDETALAARLEEVIRDAEAAVEELRAIAHGIYPTVLRERGLDDAMQSLARTAGIPVTVRAAAAGRCAPAVETAIYYCVLEAIQNATKHAGGAAQVAVAIARDAGEIRFAVVDDGAGFAPGSTPDGLGLVSMRDRIGAVGGWLEIDAAPGEGTRLHGAVPVDGGVE